MHLKRLAVKPRRVSVTPTCKCCCWLTEPPMQDADATQQNSRQSGAEISRQNSGNQLAFRTAEAVIGSRPRRIGKTDRSTADRGSLLFTSVRKALRQASCQTDISGFPHSSSRAEKRGGWKWYGPINLRSLLPTTAPPLHSFPLSFPLLVCNSRPAAPPATPAQLLRLRLRFAQTDAKTAAETLGMT